MKDQSSFLCKARLPKRKVVSALLTLIVLAISTSRSSAQEIDLGIPSPAPVGVPEGLPVQPPTALETPATEEDSISSGIAGLLPTNILQLAKSLNYWIIPFGLATFIALWFTTERIVVLRRGRVIPRPFVRKLLQLLEDGEIDREEAIQVCEENNSPVAHVFAHGVRKWGKPSVEVEQAIIDGGERQISVLRKHLRVINGVATVTPLIGLLGTVWGMLEAFNKIAEAGAKGNTDQLASGIALALVTTAAGLVIAIPSLIAYMYLSGRVDSLVMEMDDLAQKVIQNISAEGLSERTTRPRKIPKENPSSKKAV